MKRIDRETASTLVAGGAFLIAMGVVFVPMIGWRLFAAIALASFGAAVWVTGPKP